MLTKYIHTPVMVKEVVEALNLKKGAVCVDCTVGGGGHSLAILHQIGVEGQLVALDCDPEAIAAAERHLVGYSGQVKLIQKNFDTLPLVLKKLNISAIDCVLFDLGVSSHQLDTLERGFTYNHDAPLDMRMDPGQDFSAKKLVNTFSEKELAKIIKEYGEERWAGRIASFIVKARTRQPVTTTGQLVEIIKSAIPASARRKGPHPAKKTFQALRIAVNKELDNLAIAIRTSIRFLKPGGRICVISFHSLEDRVVKKTFKYLAASCTCPPELPVCTENPQPLLKVITPRPLIPTKAEVAVNPRARSARLRVAERLSNCSDII